MHTEPDKTQGRVDYLRLSITDRCNLRCTYCMPAEGVPPRSHADILSYEELAAFARVAAALRHQQGAHHRRRAAGRGSAASTSCGMLAQTSGIHDISLTTNGVLLPRYAADLRRAGLRRVNISLDSLEPERFAQHHPRRRPCRRARRPGRRLRRRLRAGQGQRAPAGGDRGRARRRSSRSRASARSTCASSSSCRSTAGSAARATMVPAPEILEPAQGALRPPAARRPLRARPGAVLARARRARHRRVHRRRVASTSASSCNRLRLTCDGRLRTCLFSGEEIAVRPLIPEPVALRAAILKAVSGKSYDRCREALANDRAMSEIGG